MEITMVIADGDGEAMRTAWKDQLLPVAQPKAAEYGWQRSLVAGSERQFVVVNVWESTEGLERAMADTDIDRVQREVLLPMAAAPPTVLRLELAEDLRF